MRRGKRKRTPHIDVISRNKIWIYYQHIVVLKSQSQSQKILFVINKHVHRHKQYIWKAWTAWTKHETHGKYLHNGIMHDIGT